MSESPYMRIKETAEYIGVAECTIRRWIVDYGFPKPIKIGEHFSSCSIWSKKMVDEWFEKMASQQNGETKNNLK